MHWLIASGALITAVASWRFVVRPLMRITRELMRLLEQIRDASGGVQRLALEVHALAGAVVQFVTRNDARITALEKQTQGFQRDVAERLTDLNQLFVDLAADIARIQRDHRPPEEKPK